MTCIFLLLLLVHSMTFKLKTTKITDKEEPSCTTPCGETGITATVCKTHSNILKQKHNTNLVLNLGQTGTFMPEENWCCISLETYKIHIVHD